MTGSASVRFMSKYIDGYTSYSPKPQNLATVINSEADFEVLSSSKSHIVKHFNIDYFSNFCLCRVSLPLLDISSLSEHLLPPCLFFLFAFWLCSQC